MKHIVVIGLFLFCMKLSSQEFGDFTDQRDGKVYKTVQIGSQIWMAENLKYRSENPRAIFSNSTVLSEVFGNLYCWEIAKEVCPDGWHLPSDEEWTKLAEYLGGEEVAGGKMKEKSTYWISFTEEANNGSGFSALPGGYLENPRDSSYPWMGEICFFWSTNEKDRTSGWFRYVKFDNNLLKAGDGDKKFGMSVRCLKD
jgi:uncharacterized protein (TIGR02145 family)